MKTDSILSRYRRRQKEPVEVRLSLRFKFGDEPGDVATMMDDRRIPMVDSIFKSRDKIVRSFTMLMVRAAAMQPKVIREIVPGLHLLAGGRRKP